MENERKFNLVKVPFWGIIAGVSGITVAIIGVVLLKKKHDRLEEIIEKYPWVTKKKAE